MINLLNNYNGIFLLLLIKSNPFIFQLLCYNKHYNTLQDNKKYLLHTNIILQIRIYSKKKIYYLLSSISRYIHFLKNLLFIIYNAAVKGMSLF